ncbi:MAG: hypothetical protein Q7K43_04395 [Candidatus Woesearchaeota archaeon]|nr:hypothetical protein [Candidatus Woesearchaeota archaeon]
MQEAIDFLLHGLGISDKQIEVVSKLRAIEELTTLTVDGETRFPLTIEGKRLPCEIVLNATISHQHYNLDAIRSLFRNHGLTSFSARDYSEQRPPKGSPLIYLTFSVAESHNVNLYLRKEEL